MIVLSVLSATAAPPPSFELSSDAFVLERTELCLPSGLRIVYQHEPQHPTVTFTTVIGTGSAADPEGLEGLAHVVEHLWFRSEALGAPVWDVTARLGASTNGSTRPDDTDYPTTAPIDALPALLRLESARLVTPLVGVTEEVFATEREVVRSELRWRYENSATSGYLALLELLFGEGHPYHRPTIGDHDSLDAMTLGHATAFAEAYYTPDNATWLVTAPLSVEAFRESLAAEVAPELIQPGSGDCNPPAGGVREPGPPPQTDPLTVEALVPSPMALLAWSLPSGFSRFDAQRDRVTELVERAIGRGARCSDRPFLRASLAYCTLPIPTTVSDREAYVRDALDDVYRAWSIDDPYEVELAFFEERADQLSWLFNQVEALPSNHLDARHVHHTRRLDWLPDMIGQSIGATRLEDGAFGRRWFDQRRAVTVILVPRSDAVGGGDNRHAQSAAEVRVSDTEEITDADIAGASTVLDLTSLRRETLPNGLEVWVLPYGRAPFARATLVMDGGWALAPDPAAHQLRSFYVRSLDGVVQNQPLRDAPLLVGGDWFVSSGATTLEYGIRGASGNLDGQLYLLRQRIDNIDVRVEYRSQIPDLLSDTMWHARDQARTWAEITRDVHLTGRHNHWDPASIDAVARVKPKAVQSWNRQIVRPTGSTLIIVGRVDPDRALADARTWFGDWRDRSDGTAHARQHPPYAGHSRRVVVLDEPGRTGASVHLACSLGPADLEGHEARRIVASTLGDVSRDRLRSQLGATYGVSTWVQTGPAGHAQLHATTDVTVESVSDAVDTLLTAITELSRDGLSPAVLDRTKLVLARRSALGLRDSREVSHQLRGARRSGDGLDRISGATDRLLATDGDAIQSALEACVDREIVTIQGEGRAVTASLDMGSVAHDVRDWEGERDEAMQTHDPKRFKKRARQAD